MEPTADTGQRRVAPVFGAPVKIKVKEGGVAELSINYKKVIDLCKKRKCLRLYTTDEHQWIATNDAIYPLLCGSAITQDALRVSYSIPEDVIIVEDGFPPAVFSYEDAEEGEQPATYERIQVSPIGAALCLRTQEGVSFVDTKCLKPLEAGKNGEHILYERLDANGNVYIVAKQGMMLEAVILPRRGVITREWLDELDELIGRLRETCKKEGAI